MRVTRQFLERIFCATNMQRWNDLLRPIEFRELDKQSHKMIIAYILGRYEEKNANVNWIEIIEGGIFEFLQRLVLTDLKPPIFHEIRKNPASYNALNKHVLSKLNGALHELDKNFTRRFKNYLFASSSKVSTNINRKILHAAHFYASMWEFNIIEQIHPHSGYVEKIRRELRHELEQNYELEGIKRLSLYSNIYNFVDLCGQLRFQVRWSDLLRLPKTSVLGHMLLVGILSYMFSLQIKACRQRKVNNFFTGLFHDLPEVLTRDIKDPLKKSIKGFERIINKFEKKEMRSRIYNILPKEWLPDIKLYTISEFRNCIRSNNKKKYVPLITTKYNKNKYYPRDGSLVFAADKIVAFLEAHMAIKSGIKSKDLDDAKSTIKKRERGKSYLQVNFAHIYDEFD